MKAADIAENILSCSICMEIFRTPRVLPCQHTFCEECLTTYIRTGRRHKTIVNVFPCLLCRADVSLENPPYDGTCFPLNLTAVALIDSLENTQQDGCRKSSGHETDDKIKGFLEEKVRVRDGVKYMEEPQFGDHDSEADFEELQCSDLFSWFAVDSILIPIITMKWFNITVIAATLKLFICLTIYVYIIYFIIVYDVKEILLVICFPLGKDVLKYAQHLLHLRDSRHLARQALLRVVSHIVSMSLIVSILLVILFSACVLESIQTQSRGITSLKYEISSQLMEEGKKHVQLTFMNAWHMMSLSLTNLLNQWRLLVH